MVELTQSDDTPGKFDTAFAGDTLNTATYLARLGNGTLNVQFVSVVGRDSISARMLATWQEEGIDTSLVQLHEHRLPGLYLVENDENGERRFFYWRSESAARTLFGDSHHGDSKLLNSTEHLQLLEKCQCIYTSGITLAIMQPDAREKFIEFLYRFRNKGGKVAFDSNYRPALWESPQIARQVITRMWSVCSIGFPSAEDEADLFGDSSESETWTRLSEAGMDEFVLKRGQSGPRVYASGGEIEIDVLSPAADVVDTTGAGDSFNAGYLVDRLNGGSVARAVIAGHEIALRVISHRGAILPRG